MKNPNRKFENIVRHRLRIAYEAIEMADYLLLRIDPELAKRTSAILAELLAVREECEPEKL